MRPQLPPSPASYRRMHKLIGPLMHKLDLSCKHFSYLSGAAMDRPLTFSERCLYIIHYSSCGVCRKVEAQMKSLRALSRASLLENQQHQPDPVFIAKVRETLTRVASESD